MNELDLARVAGLAEDAARQEEIDRVEHVRFAQVGHDLAEQVDVHHGLDHRRGAHHPLDLWIGKP